jgi:endonuclease YncB( thermonuclease family)
MPVTPAKRPAAALAAAGLLFAAACPAFAARAPKAKAAPPPPCPQMGSEAVSLAKVLSGDSVTTSDGREIRLAGVLAPGSDGGHYPGTVPEGARQALAGLLEGEPLTLAFAGSREDRYGRLEAQLFAGGSWVQAALLRAGLVRAAPDAASLPCAPGLLAAENDGRRTGFWRDGVFAVMSPEGLVAAARSRAGSFQIVEGRVTSASLVQGRAYLNFGADRRTDFTVTISPADMRGFRKAKLDPRKLAGTRIRVRGWVELYNGPEFEIASPSEIELLK